VLHTIACVWYIVKVSAILSLFPMASDMLFDFLSSISDLYKCGKSSVARDTATNVCVLPIQVQEKLGNTMSIRTYNTQRKGLCPPQSCAIQRQTSEVGALQYWTKYELIEQRMRQWQGADVGSAPFSTQDTVLDSTRGNLDTLQGISKTGKDNKELTVLRMVSYVVTEHVLCNRVCNSRD